MVKKSFINFALLLTLGLVTTMLTSCGGKCDPTDPKGECFVPCDKNDPTSDCYEQPCDQTDPTSDCYEPPQIIAVESIALDLYLLNLFVGDSYAITATVLPENATDKTVTWTSSNPADVSVENGVVTALGRGIATITAKAGEQMATCEVTVVSADTYYDIGVIINGTKWATRNVDKPGTFTATSESPGMFYQWNSNIGWTFSDPLQNSNSGSIWNSSNPTGTEWIAANNPCPAGWRVPTIDEITSLRNSGSTWTNTPANGHIFGISSGANTIFLPAAGCRDLSDGSLYHIDIYGYYWSSTPYGGWGAHSLGFANGGTGMYIDNRGNGFSVRCVAE